MTDKIHVRTIHLAAMGTGILLACCGRNQPSSRELPANHDHAKSSAALSVELSTHLMPDEAVRLLYDSLATNGPNESTKTALLGRLTGTKWHTPEQIISTNMQVDHLWANHNDIWAALSDGSRSTAIRWNFESGNIQAVLFPSNGPSIRSWTFNPNASRVLIERGNTLLLCDARSLKPVATIPSLPPEPVPASVVCFSPNSLLFAHPARESTGIAWHIRDGAGGELIRIHRIPETDPWPVAAGMTDSSLELLMPDGRIMVIPVTPVGTESTVNPVTADHYLTAIPDPHGGFLALAQIQPHAPPRMVSLRAGKPPQDQPATTPTLLLLGPWTRHPSIWLNPHFQVDPSFAFHSAITRAGQRLITGNFKGEITISLILPPLANTDGPVHEFAGWPALDIKRLGSFFPEMSFTSWQPLLAAKPDHQSSENLSELRERLARFAEKGNFPQIEEAFANQDEATILGLIVESAPSGAKAASCLQHALASTRPTWISKCLRSFPDLPPLLSGIARSRIAWLENRKADAIAAWPEPFPDYDHIRRTEDWDGWEAVDFRVAFEQIAQSVRQELQRLVVPANSTKEQRDAVFAHLTDEDTLESVGRMRYAHACLDAALRFSAHPEETARAFELAKLARAMGAPPAPCLRAEAMALTTLGDHPHARDRWIQLITNHPIADHEPGDYAEAAYSAFENNDSTQAMAILATGAHRFPLDASYAMRAGWIALLTAHPESAWRFLMRGANAGFPPDQQAHALALLAIAAFQSGAPDEAAAYHAELARTAPEWLDSEHVKTLGWPEELTSILIHLAENSAIRPDR